MAEVKARVITLLEVSMLEFTLPPLLAARLKFIQGGFHD